MHITYDREVARDRAQQGPHEAQEALAQCSAPVRKHEERDLHGGPDLELEPVLYQIIICYNMVWFIIVVTM